MEQIFYSESVNISYDTTNVYINGSQISDEDKAGLSSESYAYQKMRKAYHDVASKQYENVIVLSGAGTSVGIGTNGKNGKTMADFSFMLSYDHPEQPKVACSNSSLYSLIRATSLSGSS